MPALTKSFSKKHLDSNLFLCQVANDRELDLFVVIRLEQHIKHEYKGTKSDEEQYRKRNEQGQAM